MKPWATCDENLEAKRASRRANLRSRAARRLGAALLATLGTAATPARAQNAPPDPRPTQLVATAGPIDVNVTIGTPPPPPPPEAVVVAAPPPPPPPPPGPAVVVVEPFMRWGGDLRVGYGVPIGNVYENQSLSEIASGLYNIEGAADLIIMRRIVLGAHIGGGIASPGDGFSSACDASGASCTVWNFDVGLNAEFRFLPPPSRINPWVGLGVSYEVLGVGESNDETNISANFSGVDVDITGGLDFQLGPLGLGPFLTYRFGTYSSTNLTVNGEQDTADITHTASHSWLLLGLRARY